MSNFEIAKVAFALALLGVLFAVQGVIAPVLDLPLIFFGVVVRLRALHVVFTTLLIGSVYLYALDLLTDRPQSLIRSVGNGLYAAALVVPLVGAGAALLSATVQWIVTHINSIAIAAQWAVLPIFAVGFWYGARFQRRLQAGMARNDEISATIRANAAEASHIARAKEMLTLGHHDLAAIEAWNAVEASLRMALSRKKLRSFALRPASQIDAAFNSGILSDSMMTRAQELRRLRNDAAHQRGQVARSQAAQALDDAIIILGDIERPTDDERDG